jgi:hypothetical protein
VARRPGTPQRKKLHVLISSEAKTQLDWVCECSKRSMAQEVENIAAISEKGMLERLEKRGPQYGPRFPSKKRVEVHPIMLAWEPLEKVSVSLSVKAETKAQLERYTVFMGITLGALIEKHAANLEKLRLKWEQQKAEAKPQGPPGPPLSALLGNEGG